MSTRNFSNIIRDFYEARKVFLMILKMMQVWGFDDDDDDDDDDELFLWYGWPAEGV